MSEETPLPPTKHSTHSYVLGRRCTIQLLRSHESGRLAVMFDADQLTGDDDNVSLCSCKQTLKFDAGADDDADNGNGDEDDNSIDDDGLGHWWFGWREHS